MASRDTLSCSWPLESISASSVIAGTCRNSRSASKRRCSSVLADQGSCVVQPTWLSISLMNWPILPAAASACSRWMRTSDAFCSLYEKKMSNAPLAMSATLTTATNRARYLMNSRLRTIEALDAGSLTLFAVLRVLLPRCSDGALILAFQHFSPAQPGQRGLNSWRKERESAASFDH